jgi:hypothetical protein
MRLIICLLIAAGGYHYVSQALSERPGSDATSLPSLSSLTSTATDDAESAAQSSWLDTLRSFLNGASTDLRSTFDNARFAITPETGATLTQAARKVQQAVHVSPSCGQPDSDGNLKYCYHDGDR